MCYTFNDKYYSHLQMMLKMGKRLTRTVTVIGCITMIYLVLKTDFQFGNYTHRKLAEPETDVGVDGLEIDYTNTTFKETPIFCNRELAKTVRKNGDGEIIYVSGSDHIEEIKRNPEVMMKLRSLNMTDLLFKHYKYADNLEERIAEIETEEKQNTNERKLIVVLSSTVARPKTTSCRGTEMCRILVSPKMRTDNADAVVFDADSLPLVPPARRNSNQVFVYLSKANIPSDIPPTYSENFFNWTMSPRYDSDIANPSAVIVPSIYKLNSFVKEGIMTGAYDNVHLHDIFTYSLEVSDTHVLGITIGSKTKNYENIYGQKDSSTSSARLNNVCLSEAKDSNMFYSLDSFMNIAHMTTCGNINGATFRCTSQDLKCIARTYKFVLIYAPPTCDDYISPQIIELYQRDTVLVVHGGSEFSRSFPAMTYIDANDFSSSSSLASFLTELAANKQKYLGYIRRKDMFVKMANDAVTDMAFCRLCYKLHHLNWYEKPAMDMTKWRNEC